jgi:putative ABC transport system permease protein
MRDLWRLRGQVLAVGMVIASGVAVLVMSLSTLEALYETTDAYYERYRFGQLFAGAKRVPERIGRRIGELPGVQAVQTRISNSAILDIDGFPEPVIGRLVSIPENGQPTLNRLVLRSGRWVTAGHHDEVILSEPFAEAHGLIPGDELVGIINGHRRRLSVVGTALSPEFIYALGPGALLPDDRRFGIVWMGREALAAAFDLEGAFNDIAVTLLRGTPTAPIMKTMDRFLERFGGTSTIHRRDQLSNWFVMNEIEQLKTMSTILPVIFLTVSAFLTNMVLARLIATERSEIGLLKAFGYRNMEVGWHYTKLVLAICLVGILLGWMLGAVFGRYNTELYASLFRFPLLIYRPSPAAFSIGAALSLAAALAGALGTVRRAAALPPATAMQPPAPPSYRRGSLATTFARWFDEPTRIALRQIARWPIRSSLTACGIAFSVGLLIMAMQWNDSINHIAQVYFYEAQRQSMTVGLAEPAALPATQEFARLPGVLASEPLRIISADLSNDTRRHRGSIIGIPPETRLQPIHDDGTGEILAVPPKGLVLGTRLAEKLDVHVGDTVWVEVLEERRPKVLLPVVNVFETVIGVPAYMDLAALNELLRVRPSFEYINLLVDKPAEPELFADLKKLPTVSAVMLREAAIDAFYETLAEHLLVYIGIFTGFACALGFGVAYNSTRIALSERGRELATLRVLGFTRGEISYILLGEVTLLILLALPLGCVAGRVLTVIMAKAFDTELFRVPLVIEASTYGTAVLIALAATAASATLVRRRIDSLDLIDVLKTRE